MIELVLRLPEALVEVVSDALVDEIEALAVTVEDADAGTAGERALFGEPGMPAPAPGWQRSTLKALFENEAQAEAAAALLLAQPWAGELAVQGLVVVPDEDWVRLTQSQFAPVPVTPTFWIVPSWHEVPAAAQVVIRLDPGLAFGTGTHPTTRMCLRWIARQAEAGRGHWPRVLDYGCGSGILAIAAMKFGAGAADGVDIDTAAVESAAANAAHNEVAMTCALPDQLLAPPPAGAAADGYALVLANILATPLKLLAPLLAGQVAPGGQLLLSGILARQAEELSAAYAPHLPVQVLDEEDGWVLMGGVRTGGSARAG